MNEPKIQEGIKCSHGVQGPYATAGELIANCGERGVLMRRIYYGENTTEWLEADEFDALHEAGIDLQGLSCDDLVDLVNENVALRDLLQTLWLYTDWRYVTKQLTTEQKNLWADVIDKGHAAVDREEGTAGTDLAFHPVERWWNE